MFFLFNLAFLSVLSFFFGPRRSIFEGCPVTGDPQGFSFSSDGVGLFGHKSCFGTLTGGMDSLILRVFPQLKTSSWAEKTKSLDHGVK